MCDICKGDPSSVTPERLEELDRETDQMILEHGQVVRVVFDDVETNFAYTIGRAFRNQPELLITGNILPEVAQMILNHIGEIINDDPEDFTREKMTDGMLLQGVLGNNYVAFLKPIRDLNEAQMFGVLDRFPHAWGLQVLWPDPEHHLPHEAAYSLSPEDQPLFCD
jgi:hypothetical protein